MNWLGPFQKPVNRRIATAGISELPGMTHRQRKFIQNIATRKTFTDELMKRLIENKLPYHESKVAKRLAELTKKRVVRSLLLDTNVPYSLDRVIMIGGRTTSTPYRRPHCIFLDPDGNIVVGSNTPYTYKHEPDSVDRIQVFRYNDGVLLKSMCPSTNEIGNIKFRDGRVIFPQGKSIKFYEYSTGKMVRDNYLSPPPYISDFTDAPEGGIIMSFIESSITRGANTNTVTLVHTHWNGDEIRTVNIYDVDKSFNVCGLTFDKQGKLVVTLCSNNHAEVRIYDYKPFNSKEPYYKTRYFISSPWKTIILRNVNHPGMIAFNGSGNLLVTDKTGLVSIMTYPEGSLIHSFSCRTKDDTTPCTPIFITAGHNGDILVCDWENMCIKIFTQPV
jgi:hypothetical protein